MPFFTSDRARLFYQWHGDASSPVLVLSHSLGTDRMMWQPQVQSLGRSYRLLLYDHPGHGRSAPRKRGQAVTPISEFGQEVLALIDHLQLDRVSFCGLSLGGMVGQWLAVHAAERIERLVIANTASRLQSTELLRRRIREIRQQGLAGIVDDVIGKWLTRAFRDSHPDEDQRLREMLERMTAESYADAAETVCELDLQSQLSSIRIRTLVIAGAFDEATPPQWGREMAAEIPQATFVSLPAAHLSNIEAAEEFNRVVAGFLRAPDRDP